MKREKTACHCKNITYGMIEDAIKNGAKSYEDVEKKLRFGTGCGKCKEFIQYLIRDLLAEYNDKAADEVQKGVPDAEQSYRNR